MLQNENLLARIGFGIAKNEPSKIWQKSATLNELFAEVATLEAFREVFVTNKATGIGSPKSITWPVPTEEVCISHALMKSTKVAINGTDSIFFANRDNRRVINEARTDK